MRIFIAGTGFTGSRIAAELLNAGHEVFGMNRSGHLRGGDGVTMCSGDVLVPGGLTELDALPEMDVLVSALSGSHLKDRSRYRELYVEGPVRVINALKWKQRAQVYLLGSTGVYGGEDGEWVTEETPVNPLHANGEVQVEAEDAVRQASDTCCILRLSGLYGPGRTRLIRQALRKRDWFKPDVWSNQVRDEDVAGVVRFLLEKVDAPETVLVSDSCPALRKEIFAWIREVSGFSDGLLDEDHPVRAGRNRGNKRISNRLLRDLGYPFRYPDYTSGLEPLLSSAVSELLAD